MLTRHRARRWGALAALLLILAALGGLSQSPESADAQAVPAITVTVSNTATIGTDGRVELWPGEEFTANLRVTDRVQSV